MSRYGLADFGIGMGIAIVAASVPLYIADCAPACLRGSLVAAYQFSVGIGLIFGTATVFGTNGRKGSGSYLIPMTVQAILPLCLIIACLIMVPESPRWLAEKGQLEEARKSLRQLAGKPDINVDGDLDLIIAGIEQQRNNSWKGLLSGPEARKLMLGIGMAGTNNCPYVLKQDC
jgi:MFS family permease